MIGSKVSQSWMLWLWTVSLSLVSQLKIKLMQFGLKWTLPERTGRTWCPVCTTERHVCKWAFKHPLSLTGAILFPKTVSVEIRFMPSDAAVCLCVSESRVTDEGLWGECRTCSGLPKRHRAGCTGEQHKTSWSHSQEVGASQATGTNVQNQPDLEHPFMPLSLSVNLTSIDRNSPFQLSYRVKALLLFTLDALPKAYANCKYFLLLCYSYVFLTVSLIWINIFNLWKDLL